MYFTVSILTDYIVGEGSGEARVLMHDISQLLRVCKFHSAQPWRRKYHHTPLLLWHMWFHNDLYEGGSDGTVRGSDKCTDVWNSAREKCVSMSNNMSECWIRPCLVQPCLFRPVFPLPSSLQTLFFTSYYLNCLVSMTAPKCHCPSHVTMTPLPTKNLLGTGIMHRLNNKRIITLPQISMDFQTDKNRRISLTWTS